jgi:hypothetical protein
MHAARHNPFARKNHPLPFFRRRIIFAFRSYAADAEAEICRWQSTFSRLPPRHRALLAAPHAEKVSAARRAARTNRQLIDAILAAFKEDNEEDQAPPHLTGAAAEADRMAKEAAGCSPGDTEKVRRAGAGRSGTRRRGGGGGAVGIGAGRGRAAKSRAAACVGRLQSMRAVSATCGAPRRYGTHPGGRGTSRHAMTFPFANLRANFKP